MLTVNDADATNILQFFDELPDPRSEINRHPRTFQECFSQWIDSLCFLTDEQKAEHKKQIAIDGKALRRSHDKKEEAGRVVHRERMGV